MHNTPSAHPVPPPYDQLPPKTHLLLSQTLLHWGTQTTSPTPAPKPPKPRPTMLERFKRLDASLKEYAVVVGSILETLAPFLAAGYVVLLFVVVMGL